MAHVAKYTKGAIGHMANHYGRSDAKGKAAYVIRGNKEIKPELTHLNYNLAKDYQSMEQVAFVRKRLSEVKVQKRADVNVLCDWVVTAPKDLPEEELKPFFEATHAFLAGKYGKENVVSAYVHMDETTPHLHFAFIPVVPDKRKGGWKVSAKERLTKTELARFHGDLQNYLEQSLGIEVAILNGATREGNRSIAELRRQSAAERLQEAERIAEEIIEQARSEEQKLQENLVQLRTEIENLQQEKRNLESDIKNRESQIKALATVVSRHPEIHKEYKLEHQKLLVDAPELKETPRKENNHNEQSV